MRCEQFSTSRRHDGEHPKITWPLDILINNAGIIRDRTIKKMTDDDWHAVIRTNLDGVFHCTQHARKSFPPAAASSTCLRHRHHRILRPGQLRASKAA